MTGIIDLKAQKYYKISIKTLIHLGCKNLNLYKEDFLKEEIIDNFQVLGLPAPAFFLTMMEHFRDCIDESSKVDHLDELMSYSICWGDNNFENIMHYLSKNDEPSCIQAICEKEHVTVNYFACPNSPLEVSDEETAHALIGFYQY